MKIQMCADFKLYRKDKATGFFKPLTKEDLDSICPGGFVFEIGGKAVPFDWDAQSTSEENGVFHYESGYGPFFNDFEIPDYRDEEYKELGLKREDITAKFLASVTNIQDFYIDFTLKGADDSEGIGTNEDADAEFLIELLAISIEERETGKAYTVKKKVLQQFNGTIIVYSKLLKQAYRQYKKDWCESRGYNYADVRKAELKDEEYNGEMYACLEEFEDCEFSDDDYMATRYPNFSEMRIIDDDEGSAV